MAALLDGLRAAAEPTRLRLLTLCAHAELTVSDLTQIVGQSQPRVSRHLKLLCEAGLLARLREGTWAYYRLAQTGEGAVLGRALIDLIPSDDAALALDLQRLDAIKRSRAETAAEYFRQNAIDWDTIRALHADPREVEQKLLDLLPGGIEDLLDIGTGTGRMLALFAPRVTRALGVDQSREMLAVARANLETADLRNCSVRQADMYQLPLAGAEIDAAILHMVLHYAERPAAVIAEAARVLRPGGRLVVVDFAPHDQASLLQRQAHRWPGFQDQEIAGWCAEAGLKVDTTAQLPGKSLTVSFWRATKQPALAAVEGGRS
ncbi:MAG: metalloregulator ArsR/SmtB family transcription factor [Alphaproteobacteria bacterium]|nr:metalloregulator ArsR/SmtB family transcription factor [Alphaproteobacteria bacterium]MBU0795653.1 metalloregulator ArsR/SmtB family transcription factor [Alphaproteobacteria bacterium]MBU0887276.1 metalloregulator ArsR/SmtB family transcription factor [Alphaproteobacteria bacterium]MBU1811843.1 metalloregulator ArsR/SmtB family transcription factor [Alphaproteobacteria bacterium]MBU2091968.1 metalloregulator ArsR/SmtB family transcription factor [Alphaproteobacteria bacterium]